MANGLRINPAEKARARKKMSDTMSVEYHPSRVGAMAESERKAGRGISVGAHKELEERTPGFKMPDIMGTVGRGVNWLRTYDPWKKAPADTTKKK